MSMNRRGLLATGAAGAALATPHLAQAQPQVVWRCAGSFPKSTDVLWGVQEMFARRVGELTGGARGQKATAVHERETPCRRSFSTRRRTTWP